MYLVKPALLLTLAFTCLAVLQPGYAADTKQKNAAVVNGVPIPQARIDFVAKAQLAQSQGQQQDGPEFRENVREIMITREVLYQEALKRKFDKNPDYQLQLELAKQQIILAVLFEDFNKKIQVSDADVAKEYERVKAKQAADSGKQYKARHILVKEEAEAKQVLTDLQNGGDFAKIAAEKSTDTGSKDNGGQLDWSDAESFVQPFGEALKGLKKGELTKEPVQTNYGYHIIELQDVRTQPFPPLEQVKAQIQQGMANKAREDYIAGLRAKAKIQKINPK
ncbi:MAG TPA: peptidylprolyl isomerase [Burkholderiales bacterium]|nr:peptidylprolyl isomerase [Burkholderiales bacterium]